MVLAVKMDQFKQVANQFHADYSEQWSDEKKWQKMAEMQDQQLAASFGQDAAKMAQVSLTNGVMPDSYAQMFTDCKQGDPVDDLWKFSLAKVGAAMKDYNFSQKKEMHSFLFLQSFVSLAAAGAVWACEIPASLANIYKPFSSHVRFFIVFVSFEIHLLVCLTVFTSNSIHPCVF
jgi:hypothetical protein